MSSRGFSLLGLIAMAGAAAAGPGVVRPVTPGAGLREEAWGAHWIWGQERPHGASGYFRKAFEVGDGLRSAWIQASGDDGYTLYVNGQKVIESGFWWERTDRAEVMHLLGPGGNVIAAHVRNAADPGGLLVELTLSYEDGRTESIATDRTWRFQAAEQEGWLEAGFDDSGWAECIEMGSPPGAGPWGHLPYEYLGERARVEILGVEMPAEVEAGRPLAGHIDLRPLAQMPDGAAFTIRWRSHGGELRRETWALEPAPGAWAAGEPVRIVFDGIPTSPFLPTGECEIEFALAFTATPDGGTTLATCPVGVRNPRQGAATDVRIAACNGMPALYTGGQAAFPMWFWQSRVSARDAAAFHDAGIDGFTFSCRSYYLNPGWEGEKQYDYTAFDATALELLETNPDALCMPRIFVGAPDWWLDAHPEEACGFATGVGWQANGWGGTKHESFASLAWRRDAGEALRRFVEHVVESPYSDRVIAMHIANGIYGEWHAWSATDVPDTSEPMRQALVRYCRAKYRDEVAALRKAWGDESLTFDTVSIPGIEERRTGDVGVFRDPAVSRKVIDYYECFHRVTVDAIDHFCRIVKDASQGRLLTCVFYSYAPDLEWPQEGDHRAAALAHRLDSVDIFSSPHSYARRRLGEDALFRNYPASIALHGKLFIDEADGRTHLARDPSFTHVKNVGESLEVIRREFGNAVTHSVGLWYMDQ
ncbi:MAG: beta-galactosidase, partial [Candidatus Hydrogenedentes bacterium]|nr:beta-galactosidase [Candidatus Hydrogenedentota bacterium]